MRSLEIVIRTIAVVAIIVFVSSCASKEAKRIMNTADAVMWTRPDSALAVLESIDTLSLKAKAQHARYSLLYTMALNRNRIDTTDLHVIQPAARYYERHGSKDDKMKMYYYLGTVYHSADDLDSAIESYIRAKEYSTGSDNYMFRGLISSAISDVYAQNNNYYESISYSEEACDYFSRANDAFRLWNTTGVLACYYSNIQDWTKADSLYTVFFSQPVRDTSIYALHLMSLAFNNYFKPDSNPQESIDLFNKATLEFGKKPSFLDYCVYAGASELLGDKETADDIISQLANSGMDSTTLNIWRYRIFKHREDYKTALSLLERSITDRDYEVLQTVKQSVALAESDYYENKSLLLDSERKIQSLEKWIVSLFCLLVIAFAVVFYSIVDKKWRSQLEEMASVNDEVNQRLNEVLLCEAGRLRSIDSLVSTNEQAKKEIETLSWKLSAAGKESMVVNLRSKYVEANKRHYRQLNELCHKYLEAGMSSRGGKDKIYAEVKRILTILDEPNQKALESMLDDNLEGIMTKLRMAMPDVTEKDFRFIAFLILGFDTKTIARIMGYNASTVYTKRYNFKNRISKLNCEESKFFMEFIS